MNKFDTTGIHTVYFDRPERKGGKDSVRKRNMASRKYGTKKRVVVSDKVSELSAPCSADEPNAIEPKVEELDPVNGFVRPSVLDAVEIVLMVTSANDDVVMLSVNDDVEFKIVTETTEICAEIVGDVFAKATETRNVDNTSELYRKDLEIQRLQLLLQLEKTKGKRRVKAACAGAKVNLEEMLVRCDQWHKRSLDNIQRELYQASRVSTADSLTQLRQTDFYLSSVQALNEFEY